MPPKTAKAKAKTSATATAKSKAGATPKRTAKAKADAKKAEPTYELQVTGFNYLEAARKRGRAPAADRPPSKRQAQMFEQEASKMRDWWNKSNSPAFL